MNFKRILIAIIILFIVSATGYFFWSQYKDNINKETLVPKINTPTLPLGEKGKPYMAKITGSLLGAKAKLEIKALEIPEGFSLENCKQEYNVSYLKRPNTFISCDLSGYSTKFEVFNASFEINAEGYYSNSISSFALLIN